MLLKVGDKAPEFEVVVTGLKKISLASFADKQILLSFFNACFTPVCSLQVTDIQRSLGEIRKKEAEPLGISVDTVWAQQVFSAGLGGLSFPLGSDVSKEISTRYNVLLENGMSARAVFIISKERTIKWQKVYELKQTPDIKEILSNL